MVKKEGNFFSAGAGRIRIMRFMNCFDPTPRSSAGSPHRSSAGSPHRSSAGSPHRYCAAPPPSERGSEA